MLKGDSNLQTANTVAQLALEEVMETGAPAHYQAFTEEYSTGAEEDDLVFIAMLNTIREWTGPKEYTNSQAYKQDVLLKTYELTFDFRRKLVEYDKSGSVARALSTTIRDTIGMGNDKLVFDALVSSSGAGPTGFDGSSLINATHTWGGSSYSNKSTSALSYSTYDTAITTMGGYKKANGEPLNIFPTVLVVGPKLRRIGKEITGASDRIGYLSATGVDSLPGVGTTASGGGTRMNNVFAGDGMGLIVSQRLTGTQDDYWYLMDLSQASKPMMLKTERDWELVELTDSKDDPRFTLDKFVYSIEADKVAVSGAWPTIFGGIL